MYPGLSEPEAARRLLEHGANRLLSDLPKSRLSILGSVVREPMVALLLLCGSVYFFTGSAAEGVPLFGSVLFLVAIGYLQQAKAERSLEALRSLSSPRALVMRDGQARRIAGHEVVPDDLVLLREGDRVPADGVLLQATGLRVDESLMTGESVPRAKGVGASAEEAAVLLGTLVVAGHGMARVTDTGMRSQMGRIGASLREKVREASPLEKEIARLVWRFGIVGGLFSIAVALLASLSQGSWSRGVLSGLASALALLPEEFPLVLTLFLAMGAWRMSKRQVLTRDARAIETLGQVSTLCVDKTGTLTWNQMRLVAQQLPGAAAAPPRSSDLLRAGALASHPEGFDPMDRAILLAARQTGEAAALPAWRWLRDYAPHPGFMAMIGVWEDERGTKHLFMKGAPETVLPLCAAETSRIDERQSERQALSDEGYRVLGVARTIVPAGALPTWEAPERADLQAFSWEWLGLLALEDPLREEVPRAVADLRRAGVRVIMLTGDGADTARAIGRRAGLDFASNVVSGAELADLSDEALRARIESTGVFARVVPQHKLRIIRALQACGEVVAMTGDGVNDAPALKWADVGISMGQRGTDVAREASGLVLLDDNFATIVVAVRMGRRVYQNIMRAVSYIFAVHVPIAGLTILPMLLGQPWLLFPAHIVFMELIVDPASTLAFEAEQEEDRWMNQPPRRGPAIGLRRAWLGSAQGVIALGVGILIWIGAVRSGASPEQVRGYVFATMVIGNMALISANLSWRRGAPLNRVALSLLLGAAGVLLLVFAVPAWQRAFKVAPIDGRGLGAVALGAGMIWFGAHYFARRQAR